MAVTNRDMANAVRALSVDAVEAAKSGHVGLPLGMADAATVLFRKFLKFVDEDQDLDLTSTFCVRGFQSPLDAMKVCPACFPANLW